ncbi:MAG TPA: T9SS type A sorting domain-containing protein [Flavobacteriales bacterium]|nr:T9SS type A sorting domain-containing protein [Flavobacteriales bacterium]
MKIPRIHKALAILALAGTTATTHAAKVDITMVANSEGQLEIKLRPTANFDGMVSSLVFTVKWDASSEAHLGAINQGQPELTYLPVSRSGNEQDDGGDRYQIFVGFGMTPMQWIPTNWVAGQEYTVATIPVTGTAEFSLVNNTWTGLNNADYYLALGGIDETGEIYGDISTGIVAGDFGSTGLVVMPNPTDKATMISLDLHKAQDLKIDLVNAAGQVIWKQELPGANGHLRIPLDLSTYDKGVYMLRVSSGDRTTTRRVVKR